MYQSSYDEVASYMPKCTYIIKCWISTFSELETHCQQCHKCAGSTPGYSASEKTLFQEHFILSCICEGIFLLVTVSWTGNTQKRSVAFETTPRFEFKSRQVVSTGVWDCQVIVQRKLENPAAWTNLSSVQSRRIARNGTQCVVLELSFSAKRKEERVSRQTSGRNSTVCSETVSRISVSSVRRNAHYQFTTELSGKTRHGFTRNHADSGRAEASALSGKDFY